MKKLDEGTKVHLGIVIIGIIIILGFLFLPKNSNAQNPSDISKVIDQSVQLNYDSATIILPTKRIEIKVDTKVLFDPTGFSISSNDYRIYSFLVPQSEFDEMPTRRFFDTGEILEPVDTTNVSTTIIYGVVGYKSQVAVVMNPNMKEALPILKQNKTGIILH